MRQTSANLLSMSKVSKYVCVYVLNLGWRLT